jgi:hypothetical protein
MLQRQLSHLNGYRYQYNMYKSVRASEETHYISAAKASSLMLFREKLAVYCEANKKHTSVLCVQNAVIWYNEAGGTYKNHWALKS